MSKTSKSTNEYSENDIDDGRQSILALDEENGAITWFYDPYQQYKPHMQAVPTTPAAVRSSSHVCFMPSQSSTYLT